MNKEIEGEVVLNTCSLLIYNASAILRFAQLGLHNLSQNLLRVSE